MEPRQPIERRLRGGPGLAGLAGLAGLWLWPPLKVMAGQAAAHVIGSGPALAHDPASPAATHLLAAVLI